MDTEIKEYRSPLKNPIIVKALGTAIIVLLLLIPLSMIKNTIKERNQLRETAILETNKKWAGIQKISGPIITIPILKKSSIKDVAPSKEYIHILPEELNINGSINPENLKRGIYNIVVYEADLHTSGFFKLPSMEEYHSNEYTILWEKAKASFEIQDLKGISTKLQLTFNEKEIIPVAGIDYSLRNILTNGVTFPIDLTAIDLEKPHSFALDLDLKGSQQINFVPLGRTTKIGINSNWNSPSFFGQFLPKKRKIDNNGFVAEWEVLELNRSFPQIWNKSEPFNAVSESTFGIDLRLPIDDYQKTIRSIKYGILTIGLTFLVFFLVELISKIKTHPFQLLLIGGGLCLFYLLLISISEHSNFNIAYLISSATILLITTAYSLHLFKKQKSIAFVTMFVLASVYAFIFVTLQLTAYALLIGTVGLVITLALTMYLTRNVNWYEK